MWRVVVAVPRALVPTVGKTKLKRSLKTDSLKIAQAIKWQVVNELKKQIRLTAQGTPSDPLLELALATREALLNEEKRAEAAGFSVLDSIDVTADQLLGEPIGEDEDGNPIYDAERERRAGFFRAVSTGRGTPLMAYLSQWHDQQVNRKERTKGDDRRALEHLEQWCKATGVQPILERITRKVAGQFIADLPTFAVTARGGQRLTNKTANKHFSSLSGYWKWLAARGLLEENVWRGQFLPKERTSPDDRERPFEDEEVKKLLAGGPPKKA
jgi:hypothetical protein